MAHYDLFEHVDEEGDSLRVLAVHATERNPAYLVFRNEDAKENDLVDVRHDRGKVLSLYNALGAWLWPGETNTATLADPEPIYTALIRRLVTEEVARVLPLHQAPQAAVPERCGRIAKPGVRLKDKCPDCGYIWMTHPTHPEPDPEPHDVGHAEAPAKPHPTDWSDALFGKAEYEGHGLKFDYCTGCGHGWGTHAHSGELGWHCTAQLGKSACGCNRERS